MCCWLGVAAVRVAADGSSEAAGSGEQNVSKKLTDVRGEGSAYDVRLLLGLELLVQLSEARGSVVLREAVFGYHLAGAGDGRIVQLQIHQDVGSTPACIGG